MRVLLGAFGDAGHAFPILALGTALAAAGHDAVVQTADRWRADVEAGGMRFAPAPTYPLGVEGRAEPLTPYGAAARAAQDTLGVVEEVAPDVVVSDILTLGPALAGERLGVPVATLVPHLDPRTEPGWPPFSVGAVPAVTPVGRAWWRRLQVMVDRSLDLGARELDDVRATIGLPPLGRHHAGISLDLALIGTVPHLEYPRRDPPPGRHVVGPFVWQPRTPDVALPPGVDPLVVVAPSTAQDPSGTLVAAALDALADQPVRVLAATNRLEGGALPDAPENALVVPWMSYAQVMPLADVVVTHGGHGTLLRALAAGKPAVVVPAGGDMLENAARLDWSGAGIRLPRRMAGRRALRGAVRAALTDRRYRGRAAEIAAWVAEGDGPARSLPLVERLAARGVGARVG